MASRSCESGQNEMAENSEQSTNADLIGKSANGLVDKASEQPAVAVSEAAVERASPCPYRLFRRERSVHQIMGGGKAADVILWRRHNVTIGILFAATAAWLLFERSGYALLSLVANVLLLLIVILFLWANSAALLKRPPPPLPELELSEEIVNSAAASMRVRINYSLAVAHDIALGKDFKLFAKVVVCLWLLSVVGSWFNFLTLAYFSVVAFITIPALYDKYADQVDRFAEIAEEKIIQLSKKFDERIGSRVAMVLSKEKKIQ